MEKYAIGVDFGSLSARAVVVDVADGREAGTCEMAYAHGIMDRNLPDGTELKPDWALQDPADYIECLKYVVRGAMEAAGIQNTDVIGLGFDFTACTMLPVDKEGRPLSMDAKWSSHPNAYVKMWKHHAAQPQADRLNKLAEDRGEKFLARYGGKTSCEWMIPKIMETLEEDEPLYHAADQFMEAGDWILHMLTGTNRRSAALAGYKSLWNPTDGFPSEDFFRALDARLTHVVDEKLSRDLCGVGELAGRVTEQGAALCGLLPGTAVAAPHVDAHIALPAAGTIQPGDMLLILGTSACHIMVSDQKTDVPGLSGWLEDGVAPGYSGYEGNQVMGDHYNWMADHFTPEAYVREAKERGISVHALLSEKAEKLVPGESGLLALDWWNGNRSVLTDGQLSGLMLGMTLTTRPEEIYRALIEATAFGSRKIHEAFEQNGIEIKRLLACGGIARKNHLVMQIYCDVLGKEIRIVRSAQASALCGAMLGAVAAGKDVDGYDSIFDASASMGGLADKAYTPDPKAHEVYNRLYAEFSRLHDYFGRGENEVMKTLKAIRLEGDKRIKEESHHEA